MKKSNLVLSLAAVAFLASCNNTASELRVCNEGIAKDVAFNIEYYQDYINDEILTTKYNNFYHSMPTNLRQYSSIIDINEYAEMSGWNPFQPRSGMKANGTMHKEVNLDLDKLCYTCDYTATGTIDDQPTKDEGKYTLFFVLDEIQEEDVEEENRTGTIYELFNSNGVKRLISRMVAQTYGDFLNSDDDFYPSLYNAAFGVHDTMNSYPYCNDDYFNAMMTNNFFSDWYTNNDTIRQQSVVESFSSAVDVWNNKHNQYLEDEDDKTFCDVVYKSNGTQSFSYDVNLQEHDISSVDGTEILEGGSRYVKYLDSYLSEAESNYAYDMTMKIGDETSSIVVEHMNMTIQSHRKNTLGKANCTIPTDLDQYLPLFPTDLD